MKINFSITMSDKINQFKPTFNETENKINSLLNEKKYSEHLSTVYVGIICLSPDFEKTLKLRKPKYYSLQEKSVDGRPYTLENTLTYEIKLDYTEVLNSSAKSLELMLVEHVFAEFIRIIKNHKVVTDFKLNEFIEDISLLRSSETSE